MKIINLISKFFAPRITVMEKLEFRKNLYNKFIISPEINIDKGLRYIHLTSLSRDPFNGAEYINIGFRLSKTPKTSDPYKLEVDKSIVEKMPDGYSRGFGHRFLVDKNTLDEQWNSFYESLKERANTPCMLRCRTHEDGDGDEE